MAENVLETRILLRYGTYNQWMNSNVILRVGEAAIAAFPQNRTIEGLSNDRPENTPPAIGIKIGDGYHTFLELPWVQAVAADVFSWAKQETKPTYTAQEISGLQSFVENLIDGDVEFTIAPRIYQLVRGTGDNINKYYLQYKENTEEGDWVVDTSSYIDLSNLQKIYNWLGANNVENYSSLIVRTAEQIQYFIDKLNKEDTAVEGQFVTQVSETNGLITVERATPNFSNIQGYASVEQGGTGRSTLTEDAVLVGNGTGAVKLIPIAEVVGNNNQLVPNYLMKQYVDAATAGLTGAMHFVGEASVVINNNSSVDPRINGYNFSEAQSGDVILYDTKEFVWTGGNWRLLGDEGSYAIKGSIRDVDIDPDAEISQSKIAGLEESFNTKVDKVEGKTLTSNDFTDELKQKLDDVEDYAQENVIEHIFLNNNEVRPTTVQSLEKSVNLQVQEFDDTARTKLDGIQAGAEVNKVEKIVYDEEEILPDENKVITLTSNPALQNKIESIFINNVEWPPNAEKQVKITIDQAALNLNVLEGAQVPNGNEKQEVEQINKKLQLARIAITGNVSNLTQTPDTYIVLDCGSSTELV